MRNIGSRRLAHLGSSIFQEIELWKQEALAAGHELIDLGIGSPDQPPSERVVRALADAVQKPCNYRYPSSHGTPVLRQAIARWFAHKFGVALDVEREVLVLMGTQDGLAHLGLALADAGEAALVPDPGYPIYEANLTLAGVEAVHYPLTAANGYRPRWDGVPADKLKNARFAIINFPSNPLTATVDPSAFEEALAFCREHELLLVHDFAYSEMMYGTHKPRSLLEIPGGREHALEFHSFSKSFNMAGCRVGFVVGCTAAIDALRRLKANIDYGVFEAVQEAAVAALEEDMVRPNHTARLYEERAQRFVNALRAFGWEVPTPEATMFVWAPIPTQWPSRSFARELLLSTGVVVTPGDAFGLHGEGFVRIALVRPADRLVEAAARIGTFWKERVQA